MACGNPGAVRFGRAGRAVFDVSGFIGARLLFIRPAVFHWSESPAASIGPESCLPFRPSGQHTITSVLQPRGKIDSPGSLPQPPRRSHCQSRVQLHPAAFTGRQWIISHSLQVQFANRFAARPTPEPTYVYAAERRATGPRADDGLTELTAAPRGRFPRLRRRERRHPCKFPPHFAFHGASEGRPRWWRRRHSGVNSAGRPPL